MNCRRKFSSFNGFHNGVVYDDLNISCQDIITRYPGKMSSEDITARYHQKISQDSNAKIPVHDILK